MCEYRTDHIDEDEGFLYVDYWKTANDNEEGKVIAKIDIHNLDVLYEDETHKNNPITQSIINKTKEELKTMEFEVMTDICYDCGRVQSHNTMKDINEVDFEIFCDDCFDKNNNYTIEMAEKNQKLYRVYSSITTKYFVDIDAINEDDAMNKADDLLEDCDFIEIASPSGKTMKIEEAELLEEKEVVSL
jgi:hypothetical protein